MDLSGDGGYFRWSNSGWGDILTLGISFGWEPTGTGPPRGILKSEWDGSYYGNDGQLFYARDARALADVLEPTLKLLRSKKAPRTRPAMDSDYFEAKLFGTKPPRNGRVPIRKIDRKEAAYIREFIEFCRAGSFRIY